MMPNYYTNYERISEEAHGDTLSDLFAEPFMLNDFGPDSIIDDPLLSIEIAGTCFINTAESFVNSVEPNEFNQYLGNLSMSRTSSIENDNNRALITNSSMNMIVTESKPRTQKISIPLSQSVGIGTPQKITNAGQKLTIVNELEESFRPRYKSDYFAQNGNSRKPRYVADRQGNHFITIRVPLGIRGQVLIHWLTISDKSGERYIMPYRFQESNVSQHIPDCNPLLLDIEADRNGIMKLYLVLIKSKQDELKYLQPLQIFQPFRDAFQVPTKKTVTTLNPKQLIRQYQLDKSQLAFTFCGLSADGKSFVPEWDTTVLTTVLHELPPESTKSKSVSCPKCNHQFDLMANDEQEYIQETNTCKRKVNEIAIGRKIKKENSSQD